MALQETFESRGSWLFRYRGILPVIILCAGFVVYIFHKLRWGASLLEQQPYELYYEWFCLLVSMAGFAIRLYTVAYSAKHTSGSNVKKQVAETLNTRGIYSLVRHPLYLGNFFMWLGPTLLTLNPWFVLSFCLAFWIYYERIMFAEEAFLRRKFGSPYLEWAEKTPPFVPRARGFVKPGLPFNWKRVLKKEKNAFLAMFLVFCGFDIAGEIVQHESGYNLVFAGGLILSLVLYPLVKILKSRTAFLHENG